MARYIFTHYKQDENNSPFPEVSENRKAVEFSDDWDPWTAVLSEFADFLSGVYGYNIGEQVFVQRYDTETGEVKYVTVSEAKY